MNNGMSPLLQALNLRKSYETNAGVLEVLKGIRFSLKAGEITFIVGRSGSGKSTLLHLLGGLDQSTGGKILFEGVDVTTYKERDLARLRNRRFGFVFQFYHLLPELTVFENIMLPSLIAGKKDLKWGKEILKRVKLVSRRDYYPSELSGGEQQRVAIARALINKPSIVFCDEPTGNLDSETAESILGLLSELNEKEGQSFLIVTHDEAMAWRHQNVFRLVDGVLLRENGPESVDVRQVQS